MDDPIERLIGEKVVLDTGTPIVYVGILREVSQHTFVLDEADLHDCRDGHSTTEVYVAQAAGGGVTANRNSIVVMRSVVISLSRLGDVIT